MSSPLKYKTARRRLCGIAAVLGLAVAILRFALGRLEFIVLSDVLLAEGLLPLLFSLLQTFLILFGFALFYGFTSVLICKFGTTKTLPFIFLGVSVTIYRSLLTLVGKALIDGVSEYEFFVSVLPAQLLSLALELAQYLLVLLVIFLTLKATSSLPRSILFASLTVLLVNIGSRVVYDIGYGLPTSGKDLLTMVGAYTSDVLLYGILLFFAMRFFATWAKKFCASNT